MKKISFSDILPHALAVAVFFVITVFFFSPVFFENKSVSQGDITQFLWGSRELRDFRAQTGEEGLWAGTMFSGMPAYLVNLDWSDAPISSMKKVLSVFLPHAVSNIFLAFLCYYILLLTFKVRPYLAIAGAIAFGLSSYMIIGLSAGHNARIGAIAFMPLVMAGIHLAFNKKTLLGFGVTAAGLALHLRENHPQVIYYLLLIVLIYGLVQLIYAIREKQIKDFFKTIGVLSVAALIALGTFVGPLWAVNEYSQYSTRGKSELVTSSYNTAGTGLPKSYAFEYSNGIGEPITMLIPEFYGGSSFHAFVNDQNSKTYQALVKAGDQQLANQLAQYSSSYWGVQPLSAPYYASAIIVFLFVLGLLVVERKYIWWLLPVSILAVMLSWGSNFEAFNYFMFDYLPGYNKFRSVTFSMVMIFFAMPLLGMLAVEQLLQKGVDKKTKRQLLIAFGATGGLCFLFFLFSGIFGYAKEIESQLPAWFMNALRDDRQAMLRSDAFRSFAFIAVVFVLLFWDLPKRISLFGFFALLIILVTVDLAVVDKRYFTKENFQRNRDNSNFEPSPSDQTILQDKSYYRVFNLAAFYEARTSSFHHSLGGYHGARVKRYQELYDSCINRERDQLVNDAQQGKIDFKKYNVLNMLNAKYMVYGPDANNIIPNPEANGPAWFVKEIVPVNSPNEELAKTAETDTKAFAVIDNSKFKIQNSKFETDSSANIRVIDNSKPYLITYESQSNANGLAVFSEIYYPKGWKATIDGKEVPMLRANYVLRALEVPAGKHAIEFKFEPEPYLIGNRITMASSWVLLLVVLGTLGLSLRKEA
jgi:hypothetical protein